MMRYPYPTSIFYSSDFGNYLDPAGLGFGARAPMIPPPWLLYCVISYGVRVPVAVEAGCKLPYSVYLLTSLPRSVQLCLPGSLL